MNIVTSVKEWQTIRKTFRSKSIGLVATMGHLHRGHLSLCTRSQKENDVTVVSIFVNPTQFNQTSDFDLYPRTLLQDQALLSEQQVDYLFLPDVNSLYPDDYQLRIVETELSTILEGKFRPGHFSGVLTIILKLLNLIQPTAAYFGEKDYQQLLLVQKMASTLFLPVNIIGCETVRDTDGLALSSRNSRLSSQQRQKAAHFPRLLRSPLNPEKIIEQLNELGFKVDYIIDKWQRRLAAVWLDEVRLIDNVLMKE